MKPLKKSSYKYLLSLSHWCSDINQGSLASILPFLIAAYNYNYTTAATLVFVSNLIGSIVQPVFGDLADRKNVPWSMALAIFLAGGGMALTGFVENYALLCICVAVSGIGSAMFHPQATRLINKLTESSHIGNAISIFSFGGSFGYAIGPLVVTIAITSVGLRGTGFLCIPALLVSGFLFGQSKHLTDNGIRELENGEASDSVIKAPEKTEASPSGIEAASADQGPVIEGSTSKVIKDQWTSFVILIFFVFGRSIILTSFSTFLPLFFINVMGQKTAVSNSMLTLYYTASCITTLYGGRIADRYGYIKTVKLAFLLMVASLICFAFSRNFYLSAALLIPIATGMNISYSPIVVLGQKYLPNHVGLASGLTLGLAMSLGGLVSPFIGMISDNLGLETAMTIVAFFGIVPAIISIFLPKPVE